MIRLTLYATIVQALAFSLLSLLVMWRNAPSAEQLTIRDSLHILFADQGCYFDCLMGIRAGRNFPTPIDDAVVILEAHPWVDEVETHAVSRRTTWTWSGQQPAVIDADSTGLLIPSKLYEENISRVGIMQIPLRATLHDFVIAYGLPDSSHFGYDPDLSSIAATHIARYRDYDFQLNGAFEMDCPLTLRQLAEAPATLNYGVLTDSLFAYADARTVFPYYDYVWLRNAPFCR